MKHFLHKISQANFGNDFIIIFQIICTLCLIYFTCKSLWFIKKDVSEKVFTDNGKQHFKGFPSLAIVYLIFSMFFIQFFIFTFDEIVAIFSKGYNVVCNINSNNENPLNQYKLNYIDNIYRYMFLSLLILMLTAFSINFSKSLSTINSLEFNKLGIKSLNEIFNENVKYIRWERIIRTITAFVFILIEKELYDIEFYTSENLLIDFESLKSILFWHSFLIAGLYILLLLWFNLVIKKHIKNDNEYLIFRTNIPTQFFSGLVISFCFIFISYVNPFNFNEMKLIFGLIFLGLLFTYYLFFKSIFKIEKSFIKTVVPHYAKH